MRVCWEQSRKVCLVPYKRVCWVPCKRAGLEQSRKVCWEQCMKVFLVPYKCSLEVPGTVEQLVEDFRMLASVCKLASEWLACTRAWLVPEVCRRGPGRSSGPGPALEAAGRCELEDVQRRLCVEPPEVRCMKALALACKRVPGWEVERCRSAWEEACSSAWVCTQAWEERMWALEERRRAS